MKLVFKFILLSLLFNKAYSQNLIQDGGFKEFSIFRNIIQTNNTSLLITVNTNHNSHFKGTVHAKSLLVCSTGWCDYVFEKDYKLTPLLDIEKFIKDNKHLPDVPSAREIENKEVDVLKYS